MDYQKKTRQLLKEAGAFVEGGHFILSGGRHADFYINKDSLYVYPRKLDDIAVMMSDMIITKYHNFDVILAPSVAGAVLGQNISYNLTSMLREDILFAYADKHPINSKFRTIRRGYQNIISNKKVLLIDDVVSTGTTLVGMAQAAKGLGATVVGAAVLCDRGEVRDITYSDEAFEILHIEPLVELDLKTFPSDKCPLCKAGRPIDTSLGDATIKDLI
jgi:orotate phosphoribosyltransferase